MMDRNCIDRRILPKAKILDVRRVIRSYIATSTNRDDLLAARNAFLALSGLKACDFIDRIGIEDRLPNLPTKAKMVLSNAFNLTLKNKQ